MFRKRLIPVLLLKGDGLYKTRRFKEPKYVGDPFNAAKVFNDKEVDELVVLDIDASREGRGPNFDFVREMASECFMPLSYGGGISSLEHIRAANFNGAEKVIVNTAATDGDFIRAAAAEFGSSTIVGSIDVKKDLFGRKRVFLAGGSRKTGMSAVEHARQLAGQGVGEILINSIDRDGMMEGYDIELVREVSAAVDVPVVACGGAGSIAHFEAALEAGASAVAAGSFFVFQGKHRAVLITFPKPEQIAHLR